MDDASVVRGQAFLDERAASQIDGEDAPRRRGRPRKPKGNTLTQAVAALSSGPWASVIGFNTFSQRIEKRQPPPMAGVSAGPWRDVDTAETMLWLEATGETFGNDMVERAVMAVAYRHPFNPAQDRLRVLATGWDGVERLPTWLTEILGAAETSGNREYLAEIGAAWLKGTCARVLMPGCKRDDVLVLRGAQGWRKSTAAQAIADCILPDTFTDSVDLSNVGEAKIQIRGVTVAELPELSGMARSEIETTKAFIAAKSDHFREKFGRHAQDFPRTVSFIGTTNDPNYLKDPTGNRRWWPVTLAGPIDIDRLTAALPQLIGEAAHRVLQGEPWHVSSAAALAQAELVRAAHYDADPWTEKVLELADAMCDRGETVTTARLLDELCISRAQQNGASQKRIAGIMRTNGYEDARTWTADRTRCLRCWKKIAYTRDVVTPGYVVTASQEAAKPCNHVVTTTLDDVVTNSPHEAVVPDDVVTRLQPVTGEQLDAKRVVPRNHVEPRPLYRDCEKYTALEVLHRLHDRQRQNLAAGGCDGIPRVRVTDWLNQLPGDGRAQVDELVADGRVRIDGLFVSAVDAPPEPEPEAHP